MPNPPLPAPLPVLPGDADVEVPARSEPRATPPEAVPKRRETDLIAEELARDTAAFFRGLRIGVALALVFWAALVTLIVWLL